MKKNILYTLVIVLFGSCKQYLLYKNNITNPQIESFSSIKDYLESKDIKNKNILYLKDLESFKTFSNNFEFSVPDAYFFNKYGHFVTYKKSAEDCNAKVDDFIKDIEQINLAKDNSEINLKNIEMLLTNENKSVKSISQHNHIVVLFTFAKYMGKVNDKHTFDWIELLDNIKNEKGVAIDYYLIDVDFMDFWGINKENLPKIK